jgi:hypothetical protein
VIDIFSVEIRNVLDSRKPFEFLYRANTNDLHPTFSIIHFRVISVKTNLCHVITGPQWHGRTPVAVTGYIPVAGIGYPIAESAVSDALRYPVKT